MTQLIDLFVQSALVENLALAYFLGMCMFLAVSTRLEIAFGFGVAVFAVQTLTVPLNHLIHVYLLRPGAWAWAGLPEVDLMIRTGGDMRVSNFLLWQSAYSEWLFPDVLWPDFGRSLPP